MEEAVYSSKGINLKDNICQKLCLHKSLLLSLLK